ncbi:MAG: SDR family oxidoreductase, partial [Pirellulaceae bacterium]|nr:SDR family oxidoreductase [Pirellulaceae bacterium]
FSVYRASKAAVRNLARSWMLDLKDRRIRVNVISPGPINTPGLLGLAAHAEEESRLLAGLAASVPLGRLGHPDEIANVALFLASEEGSFLNGAELFVDGGEVQF